VPPSSSLLFPNSTWSRVSYIYRFTKRSWYVFPSHDWAVLCCADISKDLAFFFSERFFSYAEPCPVSRLAMLRIALRQPLLPDWTWREDCRQQWAVQTRKVGFGYVHMHLLTRHVCGVIRLTGCTEKS
jgi:hypothetical protein